MHLAPLVDVDIPGGAFSGRVGSGSDDRDGGRIASPARGQGPDPVLLDRGTARVITMSNASYAAFDGVTPAGLLPAAVRLLRHVYGFQGVVMSDDLDAILQPTGSGPGTVALEALRAGDDLLNISGPPSEHQAAYQTVLAAAQRSPAVRTLVRKALLRVLSLKVRYGILR